MQLFNNNRTAIRNGDAVETLTHGFDSANFNSKRNLIEILLVVMLFLLPFFFLPITTDILNLNKTYLMVFTALISLVVFFFQSWKRGNLFVKDFRSYIPISLILLAGIISTVFSDNKILSIRGQYSTYSVSLISFIGLSILGFIAVNTRLKAQKLLNAFSYGVGISSLFVWLGAYNVTLPILGRLAPGFTLTDSFYSAIGLQVVASLYSLYALFNSNKDSNRSVLGSVLSSITFVITTSFVISNFNPFALVLWALGLIYLIVTRGITLKENQLFLSGLVVFVLAIAGFHTIPAFRDNVGFNVRPEVPRLSVMDSWYVSAASFIGDPLFGTGIGSFLNDFTKFRPRSMNFLDTWNVRFYSPFNDVFTWLATGGLVGLTCYLSFLYLSGKKAIKLRTDNNNYAISFMTLMAIGSLLLMGTSIVMYSLLFILVGLMYQTSKVSVFAIKAKGIILSFLVVSGLILGGLIFYVYPIYAGQMYFRASMLLSNPLQKYPYQRKALSYDLYESLYYREAIYNNLNMAIQMSNSKDLNDEMKKQISQLLVQAVVDSRKITEIVDPRSSANWQARGVVYKAILGIDKRFVNPAVASYLNAATRDPANPALRIELGSIFYGQKQYQQAINYFAQAIQLKKDYANAYYNLSYALRDAGAIRDALIQMEIVERLISEDNPAYDKVQADLVALREAVKVLDEKAAEEAKKKLAVPSVEPVSDVVPSDTQVITNPEETVSVDPQAEVDVSDIKDSNIETEEQVDEENKNIQEGAEEEAPLTKPEP